MLLTSYQPYTTLSKGKSGHLTSTPHKITFHQSLSSGQVFHSMSFRGVALGILMWWDIDSDRLNFDKRQRKYHTTTRLSRADEFKTRVAQADLPI